MSDLPRGVLHSTTVLLQGPDAITVYNRGYYGQPQDEGVLLTGFEALHLLELGRVLISRDDELVSEQQLMAYFSQQIVDFMGRYLVYKDLRNRGYVVNQGRGSSFFFRLYRRGHVPKRDAATYYVTPLREGSSVNLTDLDELVKVATQSKKLLVVGLVDASGDVSYLEISQLYPPEIGQEFMPVSHWDWSKAWSDYLTWERD